jgi:hypothetical protein
MRDQKTDTTKTAKKLAQIKKTVETALLLRNQADEPPEALKLKRKTKAKIFRTRKPLTLKSNFRLFLKALTMRL